MRSRGESKSRTPCIQKIQSISAYNKLSLPHNIQQQIQLHIYTYMATIMAFSLTSFYAVCNHGAEQAVIELNEINDD